MSTSNNNRQALITCYFSLYQISFVRWLIFSDAELQSLHVIMNECEVFQTCIHTHILSPSFYSYFPHFLSVFPPHTQARTHTHKKNRKKKTERERERGSSTETGPGGEQGRATPVLSFLCILFYKGGPFLQEERGTVNCPRGPWENRKLPPAAEKARWNLFAGLVLRGGQRAIVREAVCAAISFLWTRRLPLP